MCHKTLEGILAVKITNHIYYLSDNIHFKMCHKTLEGLLTAKIAKIKGVLIKLCY